MWARTRAGGARLACCSLLLGACSTATDPVSQDDAAPEVAAPEDDTTTEDDFGEDDFGEPEVEQPGTEAPADGAVDQIALQLPGLPIGGPPATPISGTLQCAEVNWSGPPDLIEGVEIVVTAVSFDPPGAFTLSEEACPGGHPPCLPILPSSGEPCTVAIAWTGEPVEDDGQLFFSDGHVICEPEAEQVCTQFQADVAARGPDGITLEPPPESADETTDDPTDGTDGGGDPAEPDGSEGSSGSDGSDGSDGSSGSDGSTGDESDGGVDAADETDG